MDRLDRPEYSDEQLAELDDLKSRINVARAVLDGRLALGMTQDQLGRAAGTKQSRISELEGLSGNVRLDTLDRVARVLGLAIALVPRVPDAGHQPVASAYEEVILDSTDVVLISGSVKWLDVTHVALSD